MKRAVVSLAAIFTVATLMTTMVPARASNDTRVTISGDVSDPGLGLTLQVYAQASGSSAALSGQGGNSNFRGNPFGAPANACSYPLTGSMSGNVVTLSGKVAFSPNSGNVGIPVTIIDDASTGSITFDFNGIPFTGTGSVVIN
jgi:hypothetical protein